MPQALVPPTPPETADQLRWGYTHMVRDLLYGNWKAHLEKRVREAVGPVRREAWGLLDLSANLYVQGWNALAVLYDRAPTVQHEDEAAADLMSTVVSEALLWSMMQRVQRDTLGLREMLIRVEIADGMPVYRPVFPDHVVAVADPDQQDRPVQIWEAIPRLDWRTRTGSLIWTWDVWSIAGDEPFYRVLSADRQQDLSAHYLDTEQVGPTYAWRDGDGVPVLPYVLYHAQHTGRLWDPFATRELVEGTLNLGVKYTFLGHVERNTAWPQRVMINAMPAGMSVVDEEHDSTARRHEIVTDPAVAVALQAIDPEAGQPSIGQWQTVGDPASMMEVITQYERRLFSFFGINPADQLRLSADPRSGYAIAVSRDSQRTVQRRYEPVARAGDTELLRLTAIGLNRAGVDGTFPEDGWKITYHGIPLSAEEQKAVREHVAGQIGTGLMSRVDGYLALNPGLTRKQAEQALERIRRENAMFGE